MRNASDFSCSPSSSSNPESYVGPGDAAIKSDQTIPGCMPKMPCNCKSESNLWPHLQPTCGHQKDCSHEQLNALELETLSANCFDEIVKFGVPKNKDMGEFWHIDDQLMNLDSFDLACEEPKKLGSELESHWIGAEKTGPWWQKAGKDELASLVFLKSLENVENCDLPPQTEKFGRAASARPHCLYHRKIVDSFLDQVADKGISNLANYAQVSPNSGSMDETHCTLSDFGGLPLGLDDLFRPPTPFSNNGPNKTNMDKRETPQQPGADLSKDELLEALCHSQTRAREAEKVAQEASNEKDHIVKLFFRQASHLFAYRQWFQILQLENFCLQLKNHDHLTSVQFPGFLPWVPFKRRQAIKRRQARKGRHKAAKRKWPKGSPPGHKISKCVVAFTVGLSLAGAGLFLGWTMGWFFPSL